MNDLAVVSPKRRSPGLQATRIKELEGHLDAQDAAWKADMETVKAALDEILARPFLTPEEAVWVKSMVAARSLEILEARDKVIDDGLKFIAEERQHREQQAALAERARKAVEDALKADRLATTRRWRLAAKAAAAITPSLFGLLGVIIYSQYQRLTSVNPLAVVGAGLLLMLFGIGFYILTMAKLDDPALDTQPPDVII